LTIAGFTPPAFRFGGPGKAPTVAHSDIVTSSLPGMLAGPGVSTSPARSDILPVGVPLPWLTGTPPNGFILMDGSNVSRTTYASLFALWGTTFGAGDGSTTFGLPDWRGRTIIGAGTGSGLTARTLNTTGGEENHTLQVSEMPSHSHSYDNTGTAGGGSNTITEGPTKVGTGIAIQNTGGGGSHNNMQPWSAVNWIVRAT
jgi:microcystin-dependent protein